MQDSGKRMMACIHSQKRIGVSLPTPKISLCGDILRDYQLSKSTKILHISNGYLKLTAATPGLSNLCKL